MANYEYMTKDSFDKLKEELEHLKSHGRAEAAKAIAEARDKGDLSENAEYDAAKEAQGLLELKINELSKTLSNARIISAEDLDDSKVVVLSKVTLKNLKANKTVTYQLVSESEADLKAKKISVSSPIGKALLGKIVGEKAEVSTPGGLIEFEIMEINL